MLCLVPCGKLSWIHAKRSAMEIAFPSVCLSTVRLQRRCTLTKQTTFCRLYLHHIIVEGSCSVVENNPNINATVLLVACCVEWMWYEKLRTAVVTMEDD